ncbi:MAG: hypothetical protein HY390_06800 [Deltaproteobacteria bacterium]|nr:hypothetical protein [Deltaproteobacteria bacterium]
MRRSLTKLLTCLGCGFVFLGTTTYAQTGVVKDKTFKTNFIEFQLSNQWQCQLDGTEYVCRPLENFKKADAIIIIAAKIPGKDDNLKAYYEYLKQPKKIMDFKGRPLSSKVNVIKTKNIQNAEWIDAIHLSSELKNFYTRYLATVKNGVAILVTYSVARSRHQLYAAELNKMIATLKVIAKLPSLAGPDRKTATEKEQPSNVMVGPPDKSETPNQKLPNIKINAPKK